MSDCDLSDPDGAGADEFLSCVVVDVDLASVPSVGGTTTAEVDVVADVNLPGAVVSVSVNEALGIEAAPGFGAAVSEPSGVGPVTTVSRTVDLVAGEAVRFTVDVEAAASGTAVVQAAAASADGVFTGADETTAAIGMPGAPAAPIQTSGDRATEPAPAGAPQAPSDVSYPAVAAPVDGAFSVAPSAPGASCATGRWVFNNELGQQTGSMNYQIQVWDQDPIGGDDQLAVGVTGGNGNYTICFESTDFDFGGGQEVYVRFVSSNAAWRVRNTAASNSTYDFVTGVINIADPGTADFGTLQPSDATLHRALHAFDSLNLLYLWQSGVNSGCIDDPGECRQMVLNWTSTSVDGTYYSLGSNDIHLDSNDPDSDHITIHEGTHALMDAIYEDNYPPFPNCSPHFIFGVSSTGCAWTEGFAEWVPARVLNDPFFRFENGSGPSLETAGWFDASDNGDAVEGRIAGSLIDLSDFSNDAPWDRYGEGGSGAASEEIYTTFLSTQSTTLADFFLVDRPGEGDTGFLARAALFQNTIDYTHRDPLASEGQLTRPSLAVEPSPHNYSFSTTNGYWAGVAIRGTNDNDLRLYDDVGLATNLATSSFGGTTIDYTLIDSNHRALGDYYPQAYLFSGGADYDIELSADALSYAEGANPILFGFGTSDVIKVRDAFMTAGVTNYFRAVPSAGLDIELLGHDSLSTDAASFIQTRGVADAVGSSGGLGAAESFVLSSPESDWAGIVLLNKSGSGSVTVYRDQSVPTGASVTIAGGAATTTTTNVALTLAASDAQTGIMDMRVAVDGVIDTEPFQAYNPNINVTLPGGLGAKTVAVQFRNQAGALSATVTDSIQLVAVTCNGLTATITGSGVIAGTGANDVIVGSNGVDTITGGGGNDTICALGGNDTIADGAGADTVFGGDGDDAFTQSAAIDAGDVFDGGNNVDTVSYASRAAAVLVSTDNVVNDGAAGEADNVRNTVENINGGAGADTLVGTGAANVINGNGAGDTINGNAGNDTLNGGGGADLINGGDGDDTLTGGDGSDSLTGAVGVDGVFGGPGNDTIQEGSTANGGDTIDGGTEIDTVNYGLRTASVSVSFDGVANDGAAGEADRVINTEGATGGSGADTLTGSTAANNLSGGGGNDTINGGDGGDTLSGGGGGDTINGGVGSDNINAGDGADIVNGGTGGDTIVGGLGGDQLNGEDGADNLNALDGVNGNDSVNGGNGVDTASADPGDTVTNVP